MAPWCGRTSVVDRLRVLSSQRMVFFWALAISLAWSIQMLDQPPWFRTLRNAACSTCNGHPLQHDGCKRFASEKGTPIALQRLGMISLELSAASGFSLHLTAWYLYTYMYNSNKFSSIQQPPKNRKVFPECFRSCCMYFTFSGVTLVVLYFGPFLIDDHPKILLRSSFRSRAPHRQVHTIPEDCVLHPAGTAANTTWADRLMLSQEQICHNNNKQSLEYFIAVQ